MVTGNGYCTCNHLYKVTEAVTNLMQSFILYDINNKHLLLSQGTAFEDHC